MITQANCEEILMGNAQAFNIILQSSYIKLDLLKSKLEEKSEDLRNRQLILPVNGLQRLIDIANSTTLKIKEDEIRSYITDGIRNSKISILLTLPSFLRISKWLIREDRTKKEIKTLEKQIVELNEIIEKALKIDASVMYNSWVEACRMTTFHQNDFTRKLQKDGTDVDITLINLFYISIQMLLFSSLYTNGGSKPEGFVANKWFEKQGFVP